MTPITTIKYGNLEALTMKKIPSWTMPFLVSVGSQFKAKSNNNNIGLVAGENSVSLTNSSTNAFSQEAYAENGSLTQTMGLFSAEYSNVSTQ